MKITTSMPLTAIAIATLMSLTSVSHANLLHNTNLPSESLGTVGMPEPITLIVLLIGGLAALGARISQRRPRSPR